MSDPVKPSNTVFVASFAALLGALSMGLALGFASPINPLLETDNCPNNDCTNNAGKPNSTILSSNLDERKSQEDLIGSMLNIGALVGGLLGEPANRLLGRRRSLIVCGIPFFFGWLMIALANSVALIVTGRIVTGFTSGIVSQTAPTYVVEIAPPSIRGTLGTCFQVMVTIGILLVPLFTLFSSWKVTTILCSVFALGMSALMFFMPETPQWLLSQNLEPEAEASLKKLRNSPINEEFRSMTQLANESQQQATGQDTLATIKSKVFYKPLMLALGLMFFQQFSGINAVLFNTTKMFEKAAPSFKPAILATIAVCVAQVIATICGSVLVDMLGRRALLIASGVGHTISLLVFGIYSHYANENYAWVAVVSIVCFVVSFSIGYGPIPWMMIPEFTPGRVRSLIASISTAFNWICAYVITATVNKIIDQVGLDKTYWGFAVICALSCVFVFFSLPETKGKSEQQIQTELFGSLQDQQQVQEMSNQKRQDPGFKSVA